MTAAALHPVVAGWLALAISFASAALIGPWFRALILRREQEWLNEHDIETGPGGNQGPVLTSTAVTSHAAHRG